jgi:hypothetical protein
VHLFPGNLTSDPTVAQLSLPLRSGGFCLTTPLETDDAFLGASATAEIDLRFAPAPFRPLHPARPLCAALTGQWAALHDEAPGL